MPAGTAGPARPGPSGALLDALRARARPDGFVPLDRYLDVALYGEGVGYYRRGASPFGPAGDFYTAPAVDPLYARTLARRVAAVRAAVAPAQRCAVVDLGAGDGTLLRDVIGSLVDRGEARGIEAVAVERAAARRAAAFAAVSPVARAAGIPFDTAGSLAEAGPRRGVVLAHELLDAQPGRQWHWDGAAWRELGVRLEAGALVPAEVPAVGPAPPELLPALGPGDAGTVVERSAAAEAIVREVADHLVVGALLVVDYGAEEGELLAAHRAGTLAAVRSHRALGTPLDAPGTSDLSMFVNFSRIRRAAARAGLVEVAYRSQAEALGAWGFTEELEGALARVRGAEEEVRLRLAAKNLLFGFGTFRVLELAAPASAAALAGPVNAP